MISIEKYLRFGVGTAWTYGVLELGFLSFVSSIGSNFLGFDLMTWHGYVLIIFLGLKLLNMMIYGQNDVT